MEIGSFPAMVGVSPFTQANEYNYEGNANDCSGEESSWIGFAISRLNKLLFNNDTEENDEHTKPSKTIEYQYFGRHTRKPINIWGPSVFHNSLNDIPEDRDSNIIQNDTQNNNNSTPKSTKLTSKYLQELADMHRNSNIVSSVHSISGSTEEKTSMLSAGAQSLAVSQIIHSNILSLAPVENTLKHSHSYPLLSSMNKKKEKVYASTTYELSKMKIKIDSHCNNVSIPPPPLLSCTPLTSSSNNNQYLWNRAVLLENDLKSVQSLKSWESEYSHEEKISNQIVFDSSYFEHVQQQKRLGYVTNKSECKTNHISHQWQECSAICDTSRKMATMVAVINTPVPISGRLLKCKQSMKRVEGRYDSDINVNDRKAHSLGVELQFDMEDTTEEGVFSDWSNVSSCVGRVHPHRKS